MAAISLQKTTLSIITSGLVKGSVALYSCVGNSLEKTKNVTVTAFNAIKNASCSAAKCSVKLWNAYNFYKEYKADPNEKLIELIKGQLDQAHLKTLISSINLDKSGLLKSLFLEDFIQKQSSIVRYLLNSFIGNVGQNDQGISDEAFKKIEALLTEKNAAILLDTCFKVITSFADLINKENKSKIVYEDKLNADSFDSKAVKKEINENCCLIISNSVANGGFIASLFSNSLTLKIAFKCFIKCAINSTIPDLIDSTNFLLKMILAGMQEGAELRNEKMLNLSKIFDIDCAQVLGTDLFAPISLKDADKFKEAFLLIALKEITHMLAHYDPSKEVDVNKSWEGFFPKIQAGLKKWVLFSVAQRDRKLEKMASYVLNLPSILDQTSSFILKGLNPAKILSAIMPTVRKACTK